MENAFEVPPSPQVDFRGTLEKGDIIETTPLNGGAVTALVVFKDGMRAFFSPMVNSLELAAFWIDDLLGFGLVPPVAERSVNDQPGLLRQLVGGAKPALYYKTWEEMVQPQELLKAAVLDYILDSRDRRRENFLIDESSHKLWLINNDYYMLLASFNSRDIFNTAVNRGLTDLSLDMLAAIDKFYSGSPSLLNRTEEKETLDVLNRARERASIILDKKTVANLWH
ncbi:MAG: hypothetical protein HYT67_01680 [Candidatus Yanofskybacteria bacterium]|nr:hypothetical protein [Candidatus Yanofskybacteria bacterium]